MMEGIAANSGDQQIRLGEHHAKNRGMPPQTYLLCWKAWGTRPPTITNASLRLSNASPKLSNASPQMGDAANHQTTAQDHMGDASPKLSSASPIFSDASPKTDFAPAKTNFEDVRIAVRWSVIWSVNQNKYPRGQRLFVIPDWGKHKTCEFVYRLLIREQIYPDWALHKNSEKQVNRESWIVNRSAGSRNRLTLSGFRRLSIDDWRLTIPSLWIFVQSPNSQIKIKPEKNRESTHS
jgi:hypothetical protein